MSNPSLPLQTSQRPPLSAHSSAPTARPIPVLLSLFVKYLHAQPQTPQRPPASQAPCLPLLSLAYMPNPFAPPNGAENVHGRVPLRATSPKRGGGRARARAPPPLFAVGTFCACGILSIDLSIYIFLSIALYIYVNISRATCLSLSICLSVTLYLSIYLSIYLSTLSNLATGDPSTRAPLSVAEKRAAKRRRKCIWKDPPRS